MLGKTINGFILQRPLGKGGMAQVWYAENEIHKPAAVKILNEDLAHNAGIVERFRNEAEIMVKLDHPNIRQVYGYGTIDGCPAIIMEYLDGDDLKALMKQGRRFTPEELEKWWNQMADALNYTHAKGVIHRDIKPSNIFIDTKGNVKLLDFGIAKIKESISMTVTGATMGTLMYMSPEQVDDSKHIGPKSDFYSLAVSFVHLLTGKAPYDNTTSSDYKIRKSIVEIPLDLTGVPAQWQNFLRPYLEKDPAKRPALRPFDATVKEVVDIANDKIVAEIPVAMDFDEGTVLEMANKSTQTQIQPMNLNKKPIAEKSQNQKSGKGLWVGIGVVLAVVVAVVILSKRMSVSPNPDREVVSLVNNYEPNNEYKAQIPVAENTKDEARPEVRPEVRPVSLFPYKTDFSGTIGSRAFMRIDENGSGYYTYDCNGTDLTRNIKVKSYDSQSGHLIVESYDNKGKYVGQFDGFTRNNNSYSGTFTNYKGGTVGFSLNVK